MAKLLSILEIPTAVPGDEIYLASYNRVKQHNNMWRKDFTAEGALVAEKISKEEIQSMGFALSNNSLNVDVIAAMGFVPVGLDYGNLLPGTEEDINYGNLYVGSDADISYGDLTVY